MVILMLILTEEESEQLISLDAKRPAFIRYCFNDLNGFSFFLAVNVSHNKMRALKNKFKEQYVSNDALPTTIQRSNLQVDFRKFLEQNNVKCEIVRDSWVTVW